VGRCRGGVCMRATACAECVIVGGGWVWVNGSIGGWRWWACTCFLWFKKVPAELPLGHGGGLHTTTPAQPCLRSHAAYPTPPTHLLAAGCSAGAGRTPRQGRRRGLAAWGAGAAAPPPASASPLANTTRMAGSVAVHAAMISTPTAATTTTTTRSPGRQLAAKVAAARGTAAPSRPRQLLQRATRRAAAAAATAMSQLLQPSRPAVLLKAAAAHRRRQPLLLSSRPPARAAAALRASAAVAAALLLPHPAMTRDTRTSTVLMLQAQPLQRAVAAAPTSTPVPTRMATARAQAPPTHMPALIDKQQRKITARQSCFSF
jgi:hypothetical protein